MACNRDIFTLSFLFYLSCPIPVHFCEVSARQELHIQIFSVMVTPELVMQSGIETASSFQNVNSPACIWSKTSDTYTTLDTCTHAAVDFITELQFPLSFAKAPSQSPCLSPTRSHET
jgi:hypothetical protein